MEAQTNSSDPLDFQNIVSNYYQPLYRFAYSLARNAEEASDLTQQTFLIWAKKGSSLKDKSKVKSWLFTTLYREFLGARKFGFDLSRQSTTLFHWSGQVAAVIVVVAAAAVLTILFALRHE